MIHKYLFDSRKRGARNFKEIPCLIPFGLSSKQSSCIHFFELFALVEILFSRNELTIGIQGVILIKICTLDIFFGGIFAVASFDIRLFFVSLMENDAVFYCRPLPLGEGQFPGMLLF
jgi:hypothetical protein